MTRPPRTPKTPEGRVAPLDSSHDMLPFPIAQDEPTSPTPRRSTRIRKPPPVTPRRFKRFFAPRVKFAEDDVTKIRPPLKDVPDGDMNVRQNETEERPSKRRRLSFASSPVSFSLPSSPLKRVDLRDSIQDADLLSDDEDAMGVDSGSDHHTDASETSKATENWMPLTRKKTYRYANLSSRLVQTRLDGRPFNQTPLLGNELWQHETANFYSTSGDMNWDKGTTQPGFRSRRGPALPFCVVSCNTNPLVGVCDEDGYVRFIDSANDNADQFAKTFLSLKPHDNAIMDAAFSPDDKYLATAAGDQTCVITDVQKHKAVWCLSKHAASVKKVLFQPGNPYVLISSARDGDINIWDVRQNPCVKPLRVAQNPLTENMRACSPMHSIYCAHHPPKPKTKDTAIKVPVIAPTRTEYCVTSMTFLDETRPNLFATSSDSDSIVRLWDIRSRHSYYSKTVPISQTAEPVSHEQHRRFGVTSMVLSGDGSKFYTLCRDHTIYAYSTSHLILGTGSEMNTDAPRWKGEKKGSKTGLGPLYGFRDPAMVITDFYIKMSIRQATDDRSELLAVGSGDSCAVIYPTDERYHTKNARVPPVIPSEDHPKRLQRTRLDYPTQSLSLKKRQTEDHIPIYYLGTPLVRGHRSEVTGTSWTSEGNLVSVADDSTTRCWREDEETARYWRSGTDGNADRQGVGWAAVRDEMWDMEV
jgi:WD40 repeat protein